MQAIQMFIRVCSASKRSRSIYCSFKNIMDQMYVYVYVCVCVVVFKVYLFWMQNSNANATTNQLQNNTITKGVKEGSFIQ